MVLYLAMIAVCREGITYVLCTSLIPRPPPFFVFWFAFSIIHEAEECEKWGRPCLIHHVSDVRWTRGGCENDVRGRVQYSNMYE